MIETFTDVPSHVRDRLAAALETGLVDLRCTPVALQAVLGSAARTEELCAALGDLAAHGLSAPLAAQLVRALNRVEARAVRPDLVWSGPEVPGLFARDTRRVFEELVGGARRSIWISTYAFFDGPRAFETLARRMEKAPELQATLLLNIERARYDTTDADHLVRRFADRFWNHDWPGLRAPRVYYDPRALALDTPGAVLHAKAVVTDEESLLVTSANLTEAAFERNIELGLLVRDAPLARTVVAHFEALIDEGLLHPLPGN